MTVFYNRTSEKRKRQRLRRNKPNAECILWQKIRCKQLENCKFRSQYSVDRFVLDFYSAEIRLAIEVDGPSHFREGAREYDAARQAFIESTGIRFLRFTNAEVYNNLDGVLEVIVGKIRELRG
ncbi:MAG: endonuclease domain-containing protein [Cyanobacteriota bacterium]|nr:endonuclease domain-containing protein [Cyanobacteriota bacterium]